MTQILMFAVVLLSLWCTCCCQVGTPCERIAGKPSCVAKCPQGVIDLTTIAGQGSESPK